MERKSERRPRIQSEKNSYVKIKGITKQLISLLAMQQILTHNLKREIEKIT